MKRVSTVFFVPLLFLPFVFSGSSCQDRVPEGSSGETLVYQLWNHFKQKEFDAIKNMMASGFQSEDTTKVMEGS